MAKDFFYCKNCKALARGWPQDFCSRLCEDFYNLQLRVNKLEKKEEAKKIRQVSKSFKESK